MSATSLSDPNDASARGEPPLCVDLDGSLLQTDTLLEAAVAMIRSAPWLAFALPFWLIGGKAALKERIAARQSLPAAQLPYNPSVLAFLRAEHARGRRLVLATASHVGVAEAVAAHLGLFEAVQASDGSVNLSRERKRDRLCAAYGARGFDYIGNDSKDLPIWAAARQAHLVDPSARLLSRAGTVATVGRVFQTVDRTPAQFLRALRPHQWLKNLLVFVPLLVSHQFGDGALLGQALLAFIAFSATASAVYVINDLCDLPADRAHARKRRRPFASGALTIGDGVALIPLLLAVALGAGLFLPLAFIGTLALYFATTLSYTLYLKRVALLDVAVLAGLYTLRVVAGATAAAIAPSFWLLAFSMFLFLSLAMVKRYAEMLELHRAGQPGAAGRGYAVDDLPLIASLGGSAGYLAVLVLALYVNSPDVAALYRHPQALWLLCPALLYWISRMWLAAQRGRVEDDPIVFALRDRVSLALAAASVIIIIAAT